jgi:hypothetical protein
VLLSPPWSTSPRPPASRGPAPLPPYLPTRMPLHHVCPSLLSSSPRKQTREDSPPPSASTSSSPAFPHLRPPVVVLRAPPGLPRSPPSPGARNRPGALEIDLNIAVPLLRLLQFTVEFAAVRLPPPSPTSPSSSRYHGAPP